LSSSRTRRVIRRAWVAWEVQAGAGGDLQAADLDTAVPTVVGVVGDGDLRPGQALELAVQGGLVGLHQQQVVGVLVPPRGSGNLRTGRIPPVVKAEGGGVVHRSAVAARRAGGRLGGCRSRTVRCKGAVPCRPPTVAARAASMPCSTWSPAPAACSSARAPGSSGPTPCLPLRSPAL